VVVDDLIDETVSRPRTFFENRELGHIRHWPVFCPTLRGALNLALSEHACAHTDRGIYVCIEGPRQETPAEARKYQSYGGELIGQTLAPEVFLAKELQMNYACLGFVVRYAETGAPYPAFESGRVLSEAVLAERSRAAVERIPAIIHRVDELLVENAERNQDLLKNFAPPNGQRNGNWRAWFKQATAPRGGTEV
jgi:5'-methylthioadenosine phosphorylase